MAKTGGPLVVIVDDEEDVVTFLRLALEDHGYQVDATTRPGDALALLRRDHPDLVLLDLVMPEQTGLSVYSEILEDEELRDVQVIFLSALNVEQDLRDRLGGSSALPLPSGFVEKPIDLEALLQTLEQVLGHRPEVAGGHS